MSRKSYPPRIPKYAPGIRAQESRTGTGKSWWAKRWMEHLEAMGQGGRLGRGKNYALSGQVTELKSDPELRGRVMAKVQGSRSEPYVVTLDFRLPTGECRERIVGKLRAEPILVARLLTDELPLEVEQIFSEEGFDLFPGGKLGPGKYDMTSHCSCPDYANPCKHVTAVLLILGEQVAWRPATLLALRGIALEELYDEA